MDKKQIQIGDMATERAINSFAKSFTEIDMIHTFENKSECIYNDYVMNIDAVAIFKNSKPKNLQFKSSSENFKNLCFELIYMNNDYVFDFRCADIIIYTLFHKDINKTLTLNVDILHNIFKLYRNYFKIISNADKKHIALIDYDHFVNIYYNELSRITLQ